MSPDDIIARLKSLAFANGPDNGVRAAYTARSGKTSRNLSKPVRLVHDKLRGGDKLEGIYVHPEGVVTAFKGKYALLASLASPTGTAVAISARHDTSEAPAWADSDSIAALIRALETRLA